MKDHPLNLPPSDNIFQEERKQRTILRSSQQAPTIREISPKLPNKVQRICCGIKVTALVHSFPRTLISIKIQELKLESTRDLELI